MTSMEYWGLILTWTLIACIAYNGSVHHNKSYNVQLILLLESWITICYWLAKSLFNFFIFYLVISEPFLGDVKQFIPGVMVNLQQTYHRWLLTFIKNFIAIQNMHKILLKITEFYSYIKTMNMRYQRGQQKTTSKAPTHKFYYYYESVYYY